jgi:hypothetical protein
MAEALPIPPFWLYSPTDERFGHVREFVAQVGDTESLSSLIAQDDNIPMALPMLEKLLFNMPDKMPILMPVLERWLQARFRRGMPVKILSFPSDDCRGWPEDQLESFERISELVKAGGGEVVYAPFSSLQYIQL